MIKKRLIDEKKLIVTGLPLDDKEFMQYKSNEKEDIVIFNGRNVDEKQPWLFEQLSERLKGKAEFINTQKHNFSKQLNWSNPT